MILDLHTAAACGGAYMAGLMTDWLFHGALALLAVSGWGKVLLQRLHHRRKHADCAPQPASEAVRPVIDYPLHAADHEHYRFPAMQQDPHLWR